MNVNPDFIKKFNTPVLSYEVGDVGFLTDQDFADFSVYRTSDSDKLFEARLFPNSEGVCTAWNIGDLISQYMVSHDISFASFTLMEAVTNKSMQVNVLLCSRVFHGSENAFIDIVSKHLISSSLAVIPADGRASLYYFRNSSQMNVRPLSVYGVLESGEKACASISMLQTVKDGSIVGISISPESVLQKINESAEEDAKFEYISAITVSYGQSDAFSHSLGSIYISDDQDLIGFEFKNCFGLPETIFFHAEVLPNLSVDSEFASVGHSVVQYDVETSESFKVEASAIHASEWPRVSQFLTSPEICEFQSGRRVFLSEIEQDIGKNYDELGSIKFNYRFDDDRLPL